jgi:hypothetical protein
MKRGVFCMEATIGHLEIAIIAKKEAMTDQVKRQGNACELFFDSPGIDHMEFIPEGATINCYKEILRHLRDSIRHKNPELWCRKHWLLLHNNAPAHRSVLVQESWHNSSLFCQTLHTHLVSFSFSA